MAVQTDTTLKTYFNTGDAPTETQLAALIESAKRPYVREVVATPDTVSAADDMVLIVDTTTIAAATAINLPAGANFQRLVVKDKNAAATYNITLNRNGADTFEGGGTTYVISTNRGKVDLVFLSGVWYVLGT